MCVVLTGYWLYHIYGQFWFYGYGLRGLFKRQSSFGGDGWLYITFSLESVWTEMLYLHVRLDLNEASELWEEAVLANKDF